MRQTEHASFASVATLCASGAKLPHIHSAKQPAMRQGLLFFAFRRPARSSCPEFEYCAPRCWHQLMENAAKENLKGRCPNCRSVYDKQKITQQAMAPSQYVSDPWNLTLTFTLLNRRLMHMNCCSSFRFQTPYHQRLGSRNLNRFPCRLEEVAKEAQKNKKPERKASGVQARPRRDLAVRSRQASTSLHTWFESMLPHGLNAGHSRQRISRRRKVMKPSCCCPQSVRVVQRNLVYVVGLSMDICHEDTLRTAEFFGQFGKPVKVLIKLICMSLTHLRAWADIAGAGG